MHKKLAQKGTSACACIQQIIIIIINPPHSAPMLSTPLCLQCCVMCPGCPLEAGALCSWKVRSGAWRAAREQGGQTLAHPALLLKLNSLVYALLPVC